jgi:glycosyltransferase involved in cell wall biosynthesis
VRILIFNTFYFPKFVGGAEISVQLLAEGLTKEGNSVFVITFGDTHSVIKVNNVIVILIKQRNIYSNYNNGNHSKITKTLWHLVDSFNPLYLFFIYSIIKRINPDIVHTNNIMGFSPSLWAFIRLRKIPIVHTLRDYYLICHRCNMFNNNHTCDQLCKDCKITHALKSKFMSYPDYFIGISNYILNQHNSVIEKTKPRSVIYNGVNIEAAVSRGHQTNKLTFGYMGRISEDKGVEFLITELADCEAASKTKFRLVLAGRGEVEYIKRLKVLAVNLDIEFTGVIKPEVFYQQVDVLIVPSLWPEPFGRTVIEALSFEVPVCISQSGGLTELHNDLSTWLYVPEKNHLRTLIENIVNNQHIIEVKKANCLVSANRFDQSHYIKNYQDIYKSLLMPMP